MRSQLSHPLHTIPTLTFPLLDPSPPLPPSSCQLLVHIISWNFHWAPVTKLHISDPWKIIATREADLEPVVTRTSCARVYLHSVAISPQCISNAGFFWGWWASKRVCQRLFTYRAHVGQAEVNRTFLIQSWDNVRNYIMIFPIVRLGNTKPQGLKRYVSTNLMIDTT